MKKSNIKQKDIDLIKAMLDANIKKVDINKATSRSYNVITLVDESDGTIENYKELAYNKYKKYRPAKEKVVKASKFDETNTIVSVLKAIEHNQNKMIELLEKISNKRIF